MRRSRGLDALIAAQASLKLRTMGNSEQLSIIEGFNVLPISSGPCWSSSCWRRRCWPCSTAPAVYPRTVTWPGFADRSRYWACLVIAAGRASRRRDNANPLPERKSAPRSTVLAGHLGGIAVIVILALVVFFTRSRQVDYVGSSPEAVTQNYILASPPGLRRAIRI